VPIRGIAAFTTVDVPVVICTVLGDAFGVDFIGAFEDEVTFFTVAEVVTAFTFGEDFGFGEVLVTAFSFGEDFGLVTAFSFGDDFAFVEVVVTASSFGDDFGGFDELATTFVCEVFFDELVTAFVCGVFFDEPLITFVCGVFFDEPTTAFVF